MPFEEGDIPLLWVAPFASEFVACLEARGFHIEKIPGMTVNLTELAPWRAPDGFSIREVDADADAMEQAMGIALITNGLPAEGVRPLVEALERFPARARVRTFLASVDGVPASTSTLFGWAGAAGLYNVGTSEAFRGRGLGEAVSIAAMQAARRDGYRVGVLQSSGRRTSTTPCGGSRLNTSRARRKRRSDSSTCEPTGPPLGRSRFARCSSPRGRTRLR